MAPATNLRPSKREKRRADIKEDIKHILEEVWDVFPEEPFYKIFSVAAQKGISHALKLPNDELKGLK